MVIKRRLEVPPLQMFVLESPPSLLPPWYQLALLQASLLKHSSGKFRKWHHFTFRYSDVIRL